jgi:hypothetical protein
VHESNDIDKTKMHHKEGFTDSISRCLEPASLPRLASVHRRQAVQEQRHPFLDSVRVPQLPQRHQLLVVDSVPLQVRHLKLLHLHHRLALVWVQRHSRRRLLLLVALEQHSLQHNYNSSKLRSQRARGSVDSDHSVVVSDSSNNNNHNSNSNNHNSNNYSNNSNSNSYKAQY